MNTPHQTLGQRGETLAVQYLKKQGYHITERNWRCVGGEIDIVAEQGGEWVFVEVRTRRAPNTNSAMESITPAKQEHMYHAALAYLEVHDLTEMAWRMDVVLVALTPDGPQIEIIRDATGW